MSNSDREDSREQSQSLGALTNAGVKHRSGRIAASNTGQQRPLQPEKTAVAKQTASR